MFQSSTDELSLNMWHAIEESLNHRIDPFDNRGWPWNVFASASSYFMVDPLHRTFTFNKQRHEPKWSIQMLAFTDPDGVPTISDIKNAYLQLAHVVKESSSVSTFQSCNASISIDELSITIEEYLAGLPLSIVLYLSVLYTSDDPLMFVHSFQRESMLLGKTTLQIRKYDDFLRQCLGTEHNKFPLFLSRWPGGKPHKDWLPTWQRLKAARTKLFKRFLGGLVRCINKMSARQHRKYKGRMVKARSSFVSMFGETLKRMASLHTKGVKIKANNMHLTTTKLCLPHGTHSCNWDFIRAILDLTRLSLSTRITITHNEPVWRREHPLSKHYTTMQQFLLRFEQLEPHPTFVQLTNLTEFNSNYRDYCKTIPSLQQDDFKPKAGHWKHVIRSLPSFGTGSRKTYFAFCPSFK